MAETRYVVTTQLPATAVWSFCEAPANWVELIPGYISHEAVDERTSRWRVQVDLGPFSRLVEADATVTDVVPNERIAFTLKGGSSTPFTGGGEVRAETTDEATSIHVDVAMNPQGPLGPVVNAVAIPILPRVIRAFADELIRKLEGAPAPAA